MVEDTINDERDARVVVVVRGWHLSVVEESNCRLCQRKHHVHEGRDVGRTVIGRIEGEGVIQTLCNVCCQDLLR